MYTLSKSRELAALLFRSDMGFMHIVHTKLLVHVATVAGATQ